MFPIRAWFLFFGVAVALAAGCSRPGVTVERHPDGTHELRCDHALWQCLQHVDDYCKGASYEVVYARDEQRLYGADKSQVEARTSQAVLRCKTRHSPALAEPQPIGNTVPAAAPAAGSTTPATVPSSTSTPRAARACVPGATQACVGPAACAGGQSCLADGSGFGRCDCGPATPSDGEPPVDAVEPRAK